MMTTIDHARALARRVCRARALDRLGFGACAVACALTASCGPGKPATTLSASDSWCPEGFEVGPQDTCFAVPEATTKDTPVLVYLHGMYAGHGSSEEWSLVRSAVARGFVVVVPRGKRGLCAWKAELKDHFCWPQEIEDPQAFKSVIADWDRVLWQVDALLEPNTHTSTQTSTQTGTHKRYVLGFSNGGFFASYIAAHGLFLAQAYAIVNGGPLEAPRAGKPVPLMLLAAEEDAAQAPKMKELHEGLAKAGWPHGYCARPGPHPLASQDVDAALRFFKHEAEGSLKAAASYPCEAGTSAVAGGGPGPSSGAGQGGSAPSGAAPSGAASAAASSGAGSAGASKR
jgi:poly(3-hydroxybutyrate) depolymerase